MPPSWQLLGAVPGPGGAAGGAGLLGEAHGAAAYCARQLSRQDRVLHTQAEEEERHQEGPPSCSALDRWSVLLAEALAGAAGSPAAMVLIAAAVWEAFAVLQR